MSLRLKLVLVLSLLSATVTVAIGAWSYAVTADQLHDEIDRSLEVTMTSVLERHDGAVRRRPNGPVQPSDFREGPPEGGGFPGFPGPDPERLWSELTEGPAAYQVVGPDGDVVVTSEGDGLPVDAAVVRLAAADEASWIWSDRSIDDEPHRVVTAPLGQGRGALTLARSLAETERVLDSLRNLTLVAVVVVTATAAAFGWLIARQLTRRLVRLTDVAEEVADTGRLDVPVPVGGADETGRLGSAFNGMLSALAESREAQQRLVQDAGHELRTPLTSLRTNVSVLRRHGELPPETVGQVLDDLDGETRELTALVNELVELATVGPGDEPETEVALGPLVERVADRARRRTGRVVDVQVDDTVVAGRPQALERAVSNLLDNAAKFDDSGAPLEVSVAAGRVEVRDRGPGLDPEDLPHLFDRFYRALSARSRPGSGLGLAIVADVARTHGGSVFATNRKGGGAVVGFEVPALPAG